MTRPLVEAVEPRRLLTKLPFAYFRAESKVDERVWNGFVDSQHPAIAYDVGASGATLKLDSGDLAHGGDGDRYVARSTLKTQNDGPKSASVSIGGSLSMHEDIPNGGIIINSGDAYGDFSTFVRDPVGTQLRLTITVTATESGSDSRSPAAPPSPVLYSPLGTQLLSGTKVFHGVVTDGSPATYKHSHYHPAYFEGVTLKPSMTGDFGISQIGGSPFLFGIAGTFRADYKIEAIKPKLTVSPASIDFGTIPLQYYDPASGFSAAHRLVLTNTGDADSVLHISSFDLAAAAPDAPDVFSFDSLKTVDLKAGQSVTTHVYVVNNNPDAPPSEVKRTLVIGSNDDGDSTSTRHISLAAKLEPPMLVDFTSALIPKNLRAQSGFASDNAPVLMHWKSSTGKLADLAHAQVWEHITVSVPGKIDYQVFNVGGPYPAETSFGTGDGTTDLDATPQVGSAYDSHLNTVRSYAPLRAPGAPDFANYVLVQQYYWWAPWMGGDGPSFEKGMPLGPTHTVLRTLTRNDGKDTYTLAYDGHVVVP